MSENNKKPGRNIVVCFDGTSNEFGENNTNIVKIYRSLEKDPNTQLAFYDPGIGTVGPSNWAKIGSWLYMIFAQMTGYGISENIKDGYKFLMENYQEGDQIYIYGFSRGAFTARSLAGMISRVGILQKGLTNQVEYAYKMYYDDRNWKYAQSFKETFSRDCDIHFVGVFDTVGSLLGKKIALTFGVLLAVYLGYFMLPGWAEKLGWDFVPHYVWVIVCLAAMLLPKNYFGRLIERAILGSHRFHDTKLSKRVRNGYHALAIDEQRWLFRPTRWDTKAAEGSQNVEQVWFSGVHVDVGGFYNERTGTSDNALLWMLRKSASAGLLVKEDSWEHIQPSALTPLSNNPIGWKFIGSLSRTIPSEDKFHISVANRFNKTEKKYEIFNVVDFDAKYAPYRCWSMKILEKFLKFVSEFISK